jgi:micrococcal nuclease
MYTYKANIRSIYDGDSCRVDLDLGMGVWLHNQSIRLYGIDTAEIRGGTVETKALGNLAKDYLRNELPEGCTVMLRTYIDKRGKFGRVLASIYKQEGDGFQTKSLNTALLDMRLAVEYHGQSKAEVMAQHLENVKYHQELGNILRQDVERDS